MNVAFRNDNNEIFVENNGVVYLFGPNQSGKTYFLNYIKDGFCGKKSDFKVNGISVNKNSFNVLYYDDTTDFNSEFKFTKNNVFRELIYTSVLNNVNETKLLKEVNDLFDKVDTRVNQFLDSNLNRKQDEKMVFDIEITDVNDIIDKFTNIYIDNYLVKDSNIPRSKKRKLIYNLLLFELNKSACLDNIVFIDNFDLYLDYENTCRIISKLNNYHKKNPNTYFFLSTSSNLYSFIKEKNSIYKVCNQTITHISDLEDIIRINLVKCFYEEERSNLSFEDFYLENALLFNTDVKKKYDEILCLFQLEIGKLYISNRVRLVSKYNQKYDDVTIYCKDKFYQYFYEDLYKKLNSID